MNFLTVDRLAFSTSANVNKNDIWEGIHQIAVTYQSSQSDIPETLKKLDGFVVAFSSDNQFNFNREKTWKGGFSVLYQPPLVDGLDKTLNHYFYMDFNLKALFFQKKLQVALNFDDVFLSTFIYQSAINGIIYQKKFYADERQLRLSVRYKFGAQKIKKEDHETGNKEESARIKN